MTQMRHSFRDIRMSEYGRDWYRYVVFQICFASIFALLLSQVDLQAIYGIVAFDKLNSVEASVEWLLNDFQYGIMQVIYINSVTIAMNIAVFYTIRPNHMWRKFLGIIFDRNLWVFILTFMIFLFSMWALDSMNVPPMVELIIMMTMFLASGGTLIRYVWLCNRWLKIASAVVTISAIIWSRCFYEIDANQSKGKLILFQITNDIITVLIANVYLLFYVFIGFFLVSIVLMELRSAQSGKFFLNRRLLLSEFLHSATEADCSLEHIMKWKYSDKLLQQIIHAVFRVKETGMAYCAKLQLIQFLSRIDFSFIYPTYLSQYIQYRNRTNLMLSFLFTANALVVVLFVLPYTPRKREAIVILIVILFSRLLSRTVEVGYAFSLDVLSSQSKASSLTGADRVKLAVSSIVEMALTSSMIYFLYGHLERLEFVVMPFEIGYVEYVTDTVGAYIRALFGGVAIAVFNISYPITGPFDFTMFVHLIQVLNSVILITLSIANYLNMKKDVHLYAAERTQYRLTIWYASLQDDGEVIRREVASGRDEEEIKHFLLGKWRAMEINDKEYKEMLACIKKNSIQIDDLDRIGKMTLEQLDGYVMETLRGQIGKDIRSGHMKLDRS